MTSEQATPEPISMKRLYMETGIRDLSTAKCGQCEGDVAGRIFTYSEAEGFRCSDCIDAQHHYLQFAVDMARDIASAREGSPAPSVVDMCDYLKRRNP